MQIQWTPRGDVPEQNTIEPDRALEDARKPAARSRSFDEDLFVRSLLDAGAGQVSSVASGPAWGFAVVQDRERIRRYSDRARTLLPSELDASRGHVSELLESESFDICFRVDALVAICAPEGDRHAEADCWLAARNIELAALARGLAVCCARLVVPVLRLSEVRAELGIPSGLTCFAALRVGVPRASAPLMARSRPVVLSWVR